MDADYIGKLERGIHRWPNRQYRTALHGVLSRAMDAELGFFSTRSRAITVGQSPWQANGGDDMEQQAFVRALAGSVAGLAFSDPIKEFVTHTSGLGGQRSVGAAEVEQVQHLARIFADQDHSFGGGLSSGCATEADDWALRAKALSGLANLAVHQGRPDDALGFSEMALVRSATDARGAIRHAHPPRPRPGPER